VPNLMKVPTTALARTRRIVLVSLAMQIPETGALAAAAAITGSSALVAQTFAAAASIAVQLFLVIGIHTSDREPDSTHPLGYGRERYVWSLYAAVGIFVSGFAVALDEALRGGLHPTRVGSFGLGYAVLGVNLLLDGLPFAYALRETQLRARAQHRSLVEYVRNTTEPATVTELIANGIEVAGGALALVALVLMQATGSPRPDAIASGLIGIALMAAAVLLTKKNRELLTGPGIEPDELERMRSAIAAQSGVADVPDLFAIVVGPATLVVDGDVTFDDALSVPEVEATIERAAAALRSAWPDVRYVYLTPVASRRPRGAAPGNPLADTGRRW
jgi:cation diffusion facilitator family transporter